MNFLISEDWRSTDQTIKMRAAGVTFCSLEKGVLDGRAWRIPTKT